MTEYPTCTDCELENVDFSRCAGWPDTCIRYNGQDRIAADINYEEDNELDYLNFDEIDFCVENYLV